MQTIRPSIADRVRSAGSQLRSLVVDASVLVEDERRDDERRSWLGALTDRSLPVLCLIRGAAAMRALFGSSLGLSTILARGFGVVVESDRIGPGLRLPQPRGIVIRAGASVGTRCTLMEGVIIDGGRTVVGEGAVLGARASVLGGATVGEYAYVAQKSVVRVTVPRGALFDSAAPSSRRRTVLPPARSTPDLAAGALQRAA